MMMMMIKNQWDGLMTVLTVSCDDFDRKLLCITCLNFMETGYKEVYSYNWILVFKCVV